MNSFSECIAAGRGSGFFDTNSVSRPFVRIASGSSGRKATLAYAHSNSLRSLLEALPKSTIWRAGLMREFPGFSRHGTHRSDLPCKSPCGSLGRMAIFPGFSRLGTHRSVLHCGYLHRAEAGFLQEVQGREIRRNFSKTYADLLRPVVARQDHDRMVEFRTAESQKPTIRPENIRLTCGDAGIWVRLGSDE